MKQKLFTLICLAMGFSASAQLVNQGGTIVIESGATLVVESDISNESSGTITNSGIIEVEGDFDNTAGTLTSVSGSTLKFTGAGNSNFTAGSHTVQNLTLAKDAAGTVTLLDDLTVTNDILFENDNNQIVVNGGHVTILKISQLTGVDPMSADENEFFVTNGTGGVTAPGLGNAAHFFPVGNSVTTYNPVTITEAGTADDLTVRVLADALTDGGTGNALTENAVAAAWEITEVTPGGSDLTVEAGWTTASDQLSNFDPANSAVLMHDGTEYVTNGITFDAATVNGVQSMNGNSGFVGFTGTRIFIVGDDSFRDAIMLDLKTLISGPYNSGSALMNDFLRTGGHIPTDEPYTSLSGFTHVGGGGETAATVDFDNPLDGDDIVDWVFIEVRDGTTPTTVVQTQSALIQRDGDIVDVDGESNITMEGLANGNYRIAVRHRNHLGMIMPTAQAISSSTPFEFDFTIAANQGSGQPQLEITSGVFGLWSGDANADGSINAFDSNSLWRPQNGATYNYLNSTADFNLDASVNAVDNNAHWRVGNGQTSSIPN